jgi:hypothetical protein
MLRDYRARFNAAWTPEKYRALLERVDRSSGTHIHFRISETPCIFPRTLLERMAQCGRELVEQLLANREYLAASSRAIPFSFQAPREAPHPLFLAVDFNLVRGANGELAPHLVELQGFPSLYAFQPVLAQSYAEVYGLDVNLRYLLGGLDWEGYVALLRRAIVGGCDPESVVLLEIDPEEQKTLPDFLLTERFWRVRAVNITEVARDKRQLYYMRDGRRIPIHRIYNRCIVDELVRKGKRIAFSFRDELDVEWAGHPNWFFRLSKFSIPYLRHPCVPQTWFLDKLERLPENLDDFVLKPLYSFAGLGVVVGPTREQVEAIPAAQRGQYILQQRMRFAPVIETPHGPTQAEVRIMYVWLHEMQPVTCIVRMGRGKMMGVNHNRDLDWVGASAAFFPGS